MCACSVVAYRTVSPALQHAQFGPRFVGVGCQFFYKKKQIVWDADRRGIQWRWTIGGAGRPPAFHTLSCRAGSSGQASRMSWTAHAAAAAEARFFHMSRISVCSDMPDSDPVADPPCLGMSEIP